VRGIIGSRICLPDGRCWRIFAQIVQYLGKRYASGKGSGPKKSRQLRRLKVGRNNAQGGSITLSNFCAILEGRHLEVGTVHLPEAFEPIRRQRRDQ
jgi:hypothetical protein